MDGRKGKVVCHLRIGGDLKKEMKQELSVARLIMTILSDGMVLWGCTSRLSL